jgi:hypothetical protein
MEERTTRKSAVEVDDQFLSFHDFTVFDSVCSREEVLSTLAWLNLY